MLLYDSVGLAFIHVPKNGGKSIRRGLDANFALNLAPTASDLDMSVEALRRDYASGDGVTHPVLGPVKLEHLPLKFWQEHFALTFAAFIKCQSFILVRDPRDRFLSAVMQRLGEFKGLTALRADDPEVTREALRVCDWLEGREAFCEMEYIHFTRQNDYADLGGKRQVSAVFPIEQHSCSRRLGGDHYGPEHRSKA